jgi:hypothetical protein
MSSLPNEFMSDQLLLDIAAIARDYGARQALDPFVLGECAALVRADFQHLGRDEMRLAYRMWAAGKISALEMYGGQFNATQFGRVLAAYNAERIRVGYAIAAAQAEIDKAARDEERRSNHRAQTEFDLRNFPARVRWIKQQKLYAHPREIPLTDYELAAELDLIHFAPGQKRAIWEEAKRQVRAEQDEQKAATTSPLSLRRLKDHIERVSRTPAELRGKRLAVWVCVLGRGLMRTKAPRP